MRGRKPLELGETGEVTLVPRRRVDGKWQTIDEPRQAQARRARVRYRGYDGLVRDAVAVARKRGDAEAAVLRTVKDRLRGTDDHELHATMRLTEAGTWYLAQIAREDSGLSRRTVKDYTDSWNRYVDVEGSPVRGLTLEQANDPQRLTGFLRKVADNHGTGASKMTRSTMSGLFKYAVEFGVLSSIALRQVRTIRSQNEKPSPYDRKRAFTREQRDAVVAYADSLVPDPATRPNPRTWRKAQTTADMTAFMAGTGVRIDEARSVQRTDVDMDTGKVFIAGTKSSTAERTLDMPAWLSERLRRRLETGASGLLFAAPALLEPNTKWEQTNSAKAMRTVLNGAGFEWAIPHTFRRTVATLLDEAGVAIAQIADQLGHADPAMTARVYLGRDLHGDKSDLARHL